MFNVIITYFRYQNGTNARKDSDFIDKANALLFFFQAYQAKDIKSIDLIDGETGEVLYSYRGGRFEVVESIILR